MQKITIAVDFNQNGQIAKLMYSAFEAHKQDVSFYCAPDQVKHVKDYKFQTNLSAIKDSIFIILKEIKNFYRIDASNKLIYMPFNKKSNYYLTFLINRIDAIVAMDYLSAFDTVLLTHKLDIKVPVYKIRPIETEIEPTEYDPTLKILCIGDNRALNAMLRLNYSVDMYNSKLPKMAHIRHLVTMPDISKYNVLLYFGNKHDQLVREALMQNIIVLCEDRLPFTEYIIDNLNGFLVSSERTLSKALYDLKNEENSQEIYNNLAQYRAKVADPIDWAEYFLSTISELGAQNINSMMTEHNVVNKRWIIPKVILKDGQELRIPRVYDKYLFKTVDLHSLEQILIFFASQKFHEVYIFEWGYDPPTKENIDRILNLVYSFGKRLSNMYWCADQIPSAWQPVFSNLVVISPNEGLKRVR